MVDIGGSAKLDESGVRHDGHAVGQGHCFVLVVGDVDDGCAELGLDPLDFELHRLAQVFVEGAEWFVHQQNRRFANQCPGDSDPLLLSARKLTWIAVIETDQLHQVEDSPHTILDRQAIQPAHAQGEGHVLVDGHVREQRIFLKNHADVAPVWRRCGDIATTNRDAARARRLEAGNHCQQGRLARSRWSQHRDELTCCDVERYVLNGNGAPKTLAE